MKAESASHGKKGKREYLTDSETTILLDELNRFFESMVEVKRIRNGEHQTLETLINARAGFRDFLTNSSALLLVRVFPKKHYQVRPMILPR
jgi:hypothetical protein